MSLRAQAETDLAVTLEASGDFGWPIVLTDPAGFVGTEQLYAQTGDIGVLIDPDTGMAVTGRKATCTVRMASLTAAGFTSLPFSVPETTGKPWLVAFDTPSDVSQTYKIKQAWPDRTLGVVVLVLEFWKAAA